MISGKISQIKNKNGDVSFPITSSKAVYMEDGVTTIDKKFDNIDSAMESNVNYGLKFDGTDTSDDLLNVINNSSHSSLKFPKSVTMKINKSFIVKRGVTVDFNNSTFIFPQGLTFDAIRVNGVDNVEIKNLKIIEENHSYNGGRHGIYITDCSNLKLKNVKVEGFWDGIFIDSISKFNENVEINSCCTSYARNFGLNFKKCKNISIENHLSNYCYMDGIKVLGQNDIVNINNSESSYNGVSYPLYNGNGIDMYAGGKNIKLSGVVFRENGGDGIYIKSGSINDDTQNYINNINIDKCTSEKNKVSGLNITDITSGCNNLVSMVSVNDCNFSNNEKYGVDLHGKYINMSNSFVKQNKSFGVNVVDSFYINLENNNIIANGEESLGKGVVISNSFDVSIKSGIINGSYSDVGVSTSEESGASIYHQECVRIIGSDDIKIKDVLFKNYVNTNPIGISNWVDGGENKNIIVDYGKVKNTVSYGAYGSTLVYNNEFYIKKTPYNKLAGWEKIRTSFYGLKMFSGDGSTKVFTIAHGLGVSPSFVNLTKAHIDMNGIDYTISANSTQITVNMFTAPPVGSNNVRFYVYAE